MKSIPQTTLVVFAASIAITSAPPPTFGAEPWSQFRGPAGGAVDASLPTEWSAEKNVVWKTKLPGIGWSQPIVWGDKIFVTSAVAANQPRPNPKEMGPGIGGLGGFLDSGGGANFDPPEEQYRWLVLCLDTATGNVLWEKTAHEGRPTIHIHPNNTYASETPATDGERVVALFSMIGVYCYDLSGELLWSQPLEAYPMQFGWGAGSSPVIHGDLVYLQCDNDKSSFLAALDKRTGDEAWRVERDESSNWSTPFIWKNRLRTELVTAGGHRMRSCDPQSGELLWEMNAIGRTSSTPVADEELLYLDSYSRLTGSGGVAAAIRAGAAGNITLAKKETASEHVAWTAPVSGNRIASPTLVGGCLYFVEQGGGVVAALEAKTGKTLFRKRIPGAGGFSASPLAAGGRLYCFDQRGGAALLDAGPELKVIGSNDLGEMCWASPAVVGDRLLVRTVDHLYCIGQ